eukprot:3817327-Pyramimonas_sp.AAC.1
MPYLGQASTFHDASAAEIQRRTQVEWVYFTGPRQHSRADATHFDHRLRLYCATVVLITTYGAKSGL